MTRLNKVSPLSKTDAPFGLSLTWADGRAQTVDLSGLITFSRHFKVFAKSPDAFTKVSVINWGHGIEWENGLDYSAENLARIADEQPEETGPKLIATFKKRFDLTNEQVGRALGYKKSQIKNFRSGVTRVNPAVRVAIRTMLNDPTVLYARMGATDRKKPA